MKVPWQKERSTGGETAVQLRSGGRSTFGRLESYVPLLDGETALYREVREAVPVVDAAICKLIRLTGGVRVACGNERAEQGLQRFLREVPVGRGQRGINAFLDCYLDSLLTCGRAVGEIVPDAEGREIAAVLCADVSQVEVREGDNPLEFCLCGVDGGGRSVPLEYQDLLLFTPLNPEMEHPYGVSMLRSMPYLTGLLLKIYDAMGKNWDRCGNVRFAVTYKPQDGELDRGAAQERAEQIAEEWSRAMQEGRNGSVRDFVSVGDVSIKAIGADNQILDSDVPVRQMLEQLGGKSLGETLLTPTRIYVKAIKALLKAGVDIHAVSHITGGGFYENVPRMMTDGLTARIQLSSFPKLPILPADPGQGEHPRAGHVQHL